MEARRGQAAIDELLEQARSRYRRVTAAEAAEAAELGAVIVDIRSQEQRARDGLVPGALLVQRNVLEWRADPTCESRDEAIVARRGSLIVMCAQGYQSSLAAATLLDLGLEDATDMVGGFEGWIAAGLPVERPS